MPVQINTRVDGLQDLERNLLAISKEYGPKYALQALRPAMRAALKPLLDEIKSRTPVETGALRDSVAIRIGKPTTAQKQSKYFNKNDVLIGTVGWQWRGRSYWSQSLSIEFGTALIASRPVLRPALENGYSQMLSTFKAELDKSIEKKARQLHRRR